MPTLAVVGLLLFNVVFLAMYVATISTVLKKWGE